MSDYMLILTLSAIVPFICSFYPPLRFYANFKALFLSIVLVLSLFGTWDVVAVLRGHWQFNPKGVWPVRIFNLPLEEMLFFIVIPFCSIFTWEAMKYLKDKLK